jgi:catechol 2,3-dioxygenase-like lactoylglutathione lyase family enzyme
MRLHHVNIVAQDVPGLTAFYQTALGLEEFPAPPLIEIPGYSQVHDGHVKNPAAFLDAGDRDELQLHLCAMDHNLGARYGQPVNPVARGHVAFRCDDIEEAKRRLDDAGIPYADYGVWAVKGWYQIFFFDPVGTVVEIHQVLD